MAVWYGSNAVRGSIRGGCSLDSIEAEHLDALIVVAEPRSAGTVEAMKAYAGVRYPGLIEVPLNSRPWLEDDLT